MAPKTPQAEMPNPPAPLSKDERIELERLAADSPLVRRALDALDIERARLTVAGSDMVSAGGGYDCAWAQIDRMGEGGVFVRRSNIRQAIDAMEVHLHRGSAKAWWELVNAHSDEFNTQDPDAPPPSSGNEWVGPKETTRGENFTRVWETDNAVEDMVNWGQTQLEVWRHEHGKNMRLAHVLGIPFGTDTDDWLVANHAEAFGPDFKERLEKARKKMAKRAKARS